MSSGPEILRIQPGMVVMFVWHEEGHPVRNVSRKKGDMDGILYFSPSVETLDKSEFDVVKSDEHIMTVLSVQKLRRRYSLEKYAVGLLVGDRVLYTRIDRDCWYDMVSDPFKLEEVKL